MQQFAIPELPSNSINETEKFYTTLGFVVTYKQKTPNNFISLNYEGIELQFFGLKIKPEENFSTCYLIVTNIDKKYENFRNRLRELYGKYPIKGIPRIGSLKDIPAYGVRQFIIVDPSGNYIRIGQLIPKEDSVIYMENNENKKLNPKTPQIKKAIEAATRLIEGKHDFVAAANLLDATIKTNQNSDKLDLFKILVLRAEVAIKLENFTLGNKFLDKSKDLIKSFNKNSIKDEIRLIQELEQTIKENTD